MGTSDAERLVLANSLLELERTPVQERAGLLGPATRAEKAAEALGDETLAHRARLVHADALARSGQDSSAARILREVIRWGTRTGQRYLVARSHRHLAAIALLSEDPDFALEHAQRCVQNTGDEVDFSVAADHHMMFGIANAANGHLSAALSAFDEAEALAVSGRDLWTRLHLLNNRAYAYYSVGQADEALDVVNQMVKVADAENLELTAGMIDTHGRVLLATGSASAAMQVSTAAARREPGPGGADAADIASCRLTVAKAQMALGMTASAFTTLDQCEELADRLNLAKIRANVAGARATMYAGQERWKDAYTEHVRYHELALAVSSRLRDGRSALPEAKQDRPVDHSLSQVAVSHDGLTGLPNRRFVSSRLPELLSVMSEHDLPLGVAMIDLDHFAHVNLRVGFDEANAVLVAFADLLERHLTDHAFAARLGGEEFLLVLPAADDDLVVAFCEQVRQDVHAFDWESVNPKINRLTASFGVAVAYPDDELTQMELLRLADSNLYQAKRAGRDTIVSDAGQSLAGAKVESQLIPGQRLAAGGGPAPAPTPPAEPEPSTDEAAPQDEAAQVRWWNKEIRLRGR